MKLPLARTASTKDGRARAAFRFLILCAILCGLGSLPLLSSANAPAASLTIVNNSSREINNIFLSPVDRDEWGPDQMENGVVSPGGSHTLNIACDQATIKVITEDQNGCFLTQVVSCTGDSTWTITNAATPDCGN